MAETMVRLHPGAGVPTITPDTDTVNGAGTGIAPSAQWEGVYLSKYLATEWMAKGAG